MLLYRNVLSAYFQEYPLQRWESCLTFPKTLFQWFIIFLDSWTEYGYRLIVSKHFWFCTFMYIHRFLSNRLKILLELHDLLLYRTELSVYHIFRSPLVVRYMYWWNRNKYTSTLDYSHIQEQLEPMHRMHLQWYNEWIAIVECVSN